VIGVIVEDKNRLQASLLRRLVLAGETQCVVDAVVVLRGEGWADVVGTELWNSLAMGTVIHELGRPMCPRNLGEVDGD
jgi:hypothetical protein